MVEKGPALIDKPVALPKIAFHTAWDMAGGGDPHPALGRDFHYMSEGLRGEVETKTRELFEALGWMRAGVFDAAFLDLLTVLRWSDRQFYGWTNAADGDDGALFAAALGRDAILVATDDQTILFAPAVPTDLAAQLVGMLREAPAAKVHPLTVSRAAFADPDAVDCADPLAPIGTATSPLERFTELMSTPRAAVTQLYTAVRNKAGDRVVGGPYSVIDITDIGRVIVSAHGDQATGELRLCEGSSVTVAGFLENRQADLWHTVPSRTRRAVDSRTGGNR